MEVSMWQSESSTPRRVDVNRYSSTDNLTALDCLLVYEPLLPRSDAIHRMLLDCGAQYRHPADPGGYVHNTYIHTVRHDNDLDPLGWRFETANFMGLKYKMRRCLYGNRCLGKNRCPYLHDWDRERRRNLREHYYCSDPCFFYPHCNNPGCEFAHGDCERKFHPDQLRTRVCVEKMMCRTKACSYYHNWVEYIHVWHRQPPTFTLDLMPSSSGH
ncbi:hypothetical protein Acr_03g0005590 [Actinidia rufa]|uniref:Zinc finger C-x8-C-x5-C-x3-H type family protein n=1 Tax=Actinidia rufa TaxID=165716 RepID=A0A7J0EBK0_9ERIC|nr:hypothetical protein Acr_03g0005590 [Actinidia rufa]